jgi:hypothetical protein
MSFLVLRALRPGAELDTLCRRPEIPLPEPG